MNKLLKFSGIFTIVLGALIIAASIFGLDYTFKNIARENITTTPDSSIPSTPVRGPLTLKAQADVIRVHSLKASGGKTFAEMPRTVPQVDAGGTAVIGKDGKPVMVDNAARNIWVTATALTTALNLGILSYAFSFLSLFIGILSVCVGTIFYALSKRY